MKKTEKYEDYKAKGRMRKRVKKLSYVANSTLNASVLSNSWTSSTLNNSFSTKQVFCKATARVVYNSSKKFKKEDTGINNTTVLSIWRVRLHMYMPADMQLVWCM